MDWDDLKNKSSEAVSSLAPEYAERLEIELDQINKQGANDYWVDLYNDKFGEKDEENKEDEKDENKNGLVFPWLLGITEINPIDSEIDHAWEYQPDFPDVDTDFLPITRTPLKEYAAAKYGEDHICSVGNWITYKPKSAIQDACRALGGDLSQAKGAYS